MKNITVFSIVYFIFIGLLITLLAHDLLSSTYELNVEFLSFSFSYSISYAALILLPLLLYILIVIFSLFFSSLSKTLSLKRLEKDSSEFAKYCADLLLLKEPSYRFKSRAFKKIAPDLLSLAHNQPNIDGSALSEALSIRADILNGNVSSAKLPKNSKFYLLNQANKAASDLEEAKFFLKNKTQIDDEISAAAYNNIIKNAEYKDIKSLKIPKEPAIIMQLLRRFDSGNLTLSNAEIEVLLSSAALDAKDSLEAAKILCKQLEASSAVALFSKLSSDNEAACRAYFYTLANFGMFDELRGLIHASEAANEDFKLVIFLKDNAQNYELNQLIN